MNKNPRVLAITSLIAMLFVLAVLPGIIRVTGQGSTRGWRIWAKTSPCSGRRDWITVAKENPTEGGKGYQPADFIVMSPLKCGSVNRGCTLEEATAEAETVRASNKFFNYCCHDYSVWENAQTGELSILKGAGSRGYGWRLVPGKADLCCEQAEAEIGKTGMCPGDRQTQTQASYVGCFKDTSNYDLNGSLERSGTNTPAQCVESCRKKGFAYAAVQYGESCLCGNSYGKYGPADNCNYKCTGNANQICGGANANGVYSTGVAAPPTVVNRGGLFKPPNAGVTPNGRGRQPGDNTGPTNGNTGANTGNTRTNTGGRTTANSASRPVSIDGRWKADIGYEYEITQTGNNFSWVVTNKPDLHERAAGYFAEKNKIRATWENKDGKDTADGTVVTDSSGRATKIEWSNGIVFTRN